MDKSIINKLEILTKKIEKNQADLSDYEEYEKILLKGGLPKAVIENNLKKAGFNSWIEFSNARADKQKEKNIESAVIGGLVGLGLGLLFVTLFDKD